MLLFTLADSELQFRGWPHGERGARAYTGFQGQSPWSARQVWYGIGEFGRSPLKLKAF